MLCSRNSKKGSALVLVVLVMTVLIILGATLIEASLTTFKLSKTEGYMDYGYYAAHSAIEKCFDRIQYGVTHPDESNISSLFPYAVTAENVVSILSGKQETETRYGLVTNDSGYIKKSDFENIQVLNNTSKSAIVVLEFFPKATADRGPGKVEVTIGVKAYASIDFKPYTSGDREVYAQKSFIIEIPNGFELLGPIYTIGDVMATSSSSVNIQGDVYAYGTSPEKLTSPAQYHYGGIYAKDNSTLTIAGNAYSRSFIRTGEYYGDENIVSKSRINVKKDAIAQCIQIFGKSDKIVLHNNAYTFDDLEIDGEDSVIAVNGNYFGLSKGAHYHDETSGVINAAPVHYYSDDAMKSRIVINQAVMINGGTWRIDPENGKSKYQIEDASAPWMIDTYNDIDDALYKNAPLEPGENDSFEDNTEFSYKEWLKGTNPKYTQFRRSGNIDGTYVSDQPYEKWARGFGNLFQVWNKKIGDEQIDDWIAYIDDARQVEVNSEGITYNKTNKFDNEPNAIKGFCHSVMAANYTKTGSSEKSLFYMNKEVTDQTDPSNQIHSASTYFEDASGNFNFSLDNVKPSEITRKKLGIEEKITDLDGIEGWKAVWGYSTWGNWNSGYVSAVSDAMTNLNRRLKKLTSPFFTRTDYENYSELNAPIQHTTTGKFEGILSGVESLHENYKDSSPYILNVTSKVEFYEAMEKSKNDPTHYYMVIANGTDVGKPGKVTLKGNTTVNGAIIAAGRNHKGESSMVTPPIIDDQGINVNELDNGAYAAVHFMGNVTVNFPKPVPEPTQEENRKWLINKFRNQEDFDGTLASDGFDISTIF